MLAIEDYLSAVINRFKIRGNGEASGDCPLCGKSRDHFYIHVGSESKRHGRWICFSCGNSGDFWKLLGELEGLTSSRAKAWWLTQGQEVAQPLDTEQIRNRLKSLLRASQSGVSADVGLPYGFTRIKRRRPKALALRGVCLSTARRYGLGYCVEGEVAGRIVFPIVCPLGRSWTARAIDSRQPKYWAGPGAGGLLYGWDVAFADGAPEQLVICEGPMDVLSLYQAGLSAVAIMSKSINEKRASLLRQCGSRLMVALDSEARIEALKVASMLGADLMFLDSGDPGDASPDVLLAAVRAALDRTSAQCDTYRDKVSSIRR